jgi:hypothetical protein
MPKPAETQQLPNDETVIGSPIRLADHYPKLTENAAKLAELHELDEQVVREITDIEARQAHDSALDGKKLLEGMPVDAITHVGQSDALTALHKRRRAIAEALSLLKNQDAADRRAAANVVADKIEPQVRQRFKRLVNTLVEVIEASSDYEAAYQWLDRVGALPRHGLPFGVTSFIGRADYHGSAITWLRELLQKGELIRTELPAWFFEATPDAAGDHAASRNAEARGAYHRAQSALRRVAAANYQDEERQAHDLAGAQALLAEKRRQLEELGLPIPGAQSQGNLRA